MKTLRHLLPLLLACAAFLPLLARAAEKDRLRLTVVFTGDVSGYLEPCG